MFVIATAHLLRVQKRKNISENVRLHKSQHLVAGKHLTRKREVSPEKRMLSLALAAILVVLLILVAVIAAAWITSSNCCRQNNRHLQLLEDRLETAIAELQTQQANCCTQSYLTAASDGAYFLYTGANVLTWDSTPQMATPVDGWTTTVNTGGQSVAWSVPADGVYSVNYNVVVGSNAAASMLLVDGQVALRSMSSTVDRTSTDVIARPLTKTFDIQLSAGSTVAVVVVSFLGAGILPPPTAGLPSRFLNTLTMTLLDANPAEGVDPGADLIGTLTTLDDWMTSSCVQTAVSDARTQAASATTLAQLFSVVDTFAANLTLC
jgi:hypothetical protein